MAKLNYEMSQDSLQVFFENGDIELINRGEKNFEAIRELIFQNDGDVDVNRFYETLHFTPYANLHLLSDRISYDGANLRFDGAVVHSALAEYIIELHLTKNPQATAFVNFMENLMNNPSESSKAELYNWINTLKGRGEKLTINPAGMLIAYKGVLIDSEGEPASINSGPGYVNGVAQRGHLKNTVGSVLSVDRAYVDSDTNVGCSRGLHAGTWSYAHGFAQGMTLMVEINPRDVVSVPNDCNFQKLRVCRYTVVEAMDAPETLPVARGSYDWDEEEWDEWVEEYGFDEEDAEIYVNRGYSFDEAVRIERSGGLTDDDNHSLAEWRELDFTDEQIAILQDNDVTFEDAANGDYDESILEVAEKGDLDSWLALGFTMREVRLLKNAGVSYEDASLENFDVSILANVETVKVSSGEAAKAKKKNKKNKKKNKKNKAKNISQSSQF